MAQGLPFRSLPWEPEENGVDERQDVGMKSLLQRKRQEESQVPQACRRQAQARREEEQRLAREAEAAAAAAEEARQAEEAARKAAEDRAEQDREARKKALHERFKGLLQKKRGEELNDSAQAEACRPEEEHITAKGTEASQVEEASRKSEEKEPQEEEEEELREEPAEAQGFRKFPWS
ncbi:unnamed protein product [Symbiodinium natans]|uniref:Uncharacterized protein n=1 Tax=Symbiodinium natans TaxID=878477 RepID=A0A812MUB7_9DINO|nr:unnamed protein product [Symbiodinium natans]